jgi:hypothetical protein
MYKFISKHTKSLALPSFFIPLGLTPLVAEYPDVNIYLKYISVSALSIIALVFLFHLVRATAYKFIPRRFANLVFALDEEDNLAVIEHRLYKRFQPPGSRLYYHETPHSAIERVMSNELGLNQEQYKILSEDAELPNYNRAFTVPKPFQVQVEMGKHKLGIKEHYDFLYAVRVSGIRPKLNSDQHPRWVSLKELELLIQDNIEKAPWESIIPTYKSLLSRLNSFSHISINYTKAID